MNTAARIAMLNYLKSIGTTEVLLVTPNSRCMVSIDAVIESINQSHQAQGETP